MTDIFSNNISLSVLVFKKFYKDVIFSKDYIFIELLEHNQLISLKKN
jgi:hypothetical protein